MLSKILKDILRNYIESEEYSKNILLGIQIVHFEIDLHNSDIANNYGLDYWHYYHLELDLNKLDYETYKKRIEILNYIGSKCSIDMEGFRVDIDINFKEITYKNLFEQLKLKYEKYMQYLNLLEVFNFKVIFLISHKINFILSIEEIKSIFSFYEQYLRLIYSKTHNNVSIELNMYKGKKLAYTLSMIINNKHDDIYYRCIESQKMCMNNISNKLEEVYKE